MTEEQIKEYERLSELKDAYERFIRRDGNVAIVYHSEIYHDYIHIRVKDNDFKKIVKNIAKERLENINKQIEKL